MSTEAAADARKRKWDEPGAAPSADGASGDGAAAPAAKQQKTDGAAELEGGQDALDAAAQVAARLSAQYAPKAASGGVYVKDQREASDPEFVKDIEINDMRNRYVLTKGSTQQQILADTGANVQSKGLWYPDKSMATDKDPPLYLHITADTAEKLQKGVEAVEKLIEQELGPLLDERRFRRREDEPREKRKWLEEKIPIDVEPLRNFNVRAKVVGPGGLFVKFIQQETGTRVQIKGTGSGFIETETGRESEDPMHIHVAGPDEAMVERAVELGKDLLTVVKEEHAKARAVLEQQWAAQQQGYQPQQPPYGGQQGYGGQQQPYQGGYQQSPYGAGVTAPLPQGEAPPPPPPSGDAPPGPPADPSQPGGQQASAEQWAAYWNSLDPASQAYYTQYYAAYQQGGYSGSPATQGQTPQPPQGGSAPPPPPPSSAPPPPPPQGDEQKGGSGRFGAVPPPPGL
ncbi:hypothetical protein OIV83_006221 [Microbotryomycetes sp. JL201]|nr:hypothetical protein OIV83_006221 [Microbotryomycetes sp. JL201]